MWSVDASNYLKGLQSKSAARFPKKIIRQKGRKRIKENLMIFFFQFNSKNFLRGLKFRWGIFKGARGGGFWVGRFKRGADLEHNRFDDYCLATMDPWWNNVCWVPCPKKLLYLKPLLATNFGFVGLSLHLGVHSLWPQGSVRFGNRGSTGFIKNFFSLPTRSNFGFGS